MMLILHQKIIHYRKDIGIRVFQLLIELIIQIINFY